MAKTIIDVSTFQDTIRWDVVKGNVDGAILRVGFRGWGKEGTLCVDSCFEENLRGVQQQKIPFSVYWFTQAVTPEEAREEARFTVEQLGDAVLAGPVFIDTEYGNGSQTGRADKLDTDTRTQCVRAFCEEVQKLGYTAGVYASQNWFREFLNTASLTDYVLWVAKFSSEAPEIGYPYSGWQYTAEGSCPGISGGVDKSLFYRDFGDDDTTPPQPEKPDPKPDASPVVLNNTPCYVSAFVEDSFGTKSGTYYRWDDEVVNGRIRITNKPENAGVSGQITCWVAKDTPASGGSVSKPGSPVVLNNTPCYVSSTAEKSFGTKSGTYYRWDDEAVNGRIRITNKPENAGVAGQITCWVAENVPSGGEQEAAGSPVVLSNTPCYVSASAEESFGTKSGTYYRWDDEVINGRIRITNKSENAGVAGQITCWVKLNSVSR